MSHCKSPRVGSRYYLPKWQYKETVAFCYRYSEMQEELKSLTAVKAMQYDGMPHGTSVGSPTESQAVRIAELKKNIELIERTVRECAGTLSKWLLKGITDERTTYWKLREFDHIPVGVNLYGSIRQHIYFEIARKRN